MQIERGPGDLGEAHLGDVAGGLAQGVQRVRRVEIHHIPEVVIVKINSGVLSATGQKHICYTVLERGPVDDLYIEIVQFLQKAVRCILTQLGEIVRHIVLDSVFCGGYERLGEGAFLLQLPEAVFQGLRDLGLVLRAHGPDGHGTRESAGVGVGNIEVVFEPGPALIVPIKNRDTGSSPVDPAPELPVPAFYLQHGGGVWALGIDHELFLKGEAVVPAAV